MSRRTLPSPGTVISMVALLVALSGTAVALEGRNSVDKNDIKRNAVRAKQVKDGQVRAAEIADGAVGTAEIADGAVGTAEIGDSAVGTAEIAGGAVGTAEIGDGEVGTAEIAGGAVGTAEIGDGEVRAADIDQLEFSHAPAQVSNSGSAGDASFADDPRITVEAQPGDVILFHGRVDIRRDTGAGRCNVDIEITPPEGLSLSARILASDSAAFETVYMDTDDDVVSGTTSISDPVGRQLPVLADGPFVFTLSYNQGNPATDCTYRERALWVGLLR